MSETEHAANYKDLVSQAFSHLEHGQQLAPPPERPGDPLDNVVLSVIGALRAETRLYPEVYAWIIADAVRASLLDEPVDEGHTEIAIEALQAAQVAAESIPAAYPKSRLLTLLKGVWEAGWRPVGSPPGEGNPKEQADQSPEEVK